MQVGMLFRTIAAALCWFACLTGVPAANAASATDTGPAMRFVVVRADGKSCVPICPEWISAEGAFVAATPARFKKFIARLGRRKLPVVFHSGGGSVSAAFELGRMIRAAGLATAVGRTYFTSCSPESRDCQAEKQGGYTGSAVSMSARCYSACALALAGGVSRLVGGHASFGVHQITAIHEEVRTTYRLRKQVVNGRTKTVKEVISRKKTGVKRVGDGTPALRGEILKFYRAMGVSEDIYPLFSSTPASEIRVLTQAELVAFRMTTEHGGVEKWTDAAICEEAFAWPHCRRVASPPQLRIVKSRDRECGRECAKWIVLEGDIDEAAVTLVTAAVAQNSGLPVVLSSRGGNAKSALELGRLFRERAVNVIIGRMISSQCRETDAACEGKLGDDLHLGRMNLQSARPYCSNVCLFALAGGVERTVPDTVSVFVDKFSLLQELPKPGRQSGGFERQLISYLAEMGVSSDILALAPASSLANDFKLTASVLLRSRLATRQK